MSIPGNLGARGKSQSWEIIDFEKEFKKSPVPEEAQQAFKTLSSLTSQETPLVSETPPKAASQEAPPKIYGPSSDSPISSEILRRILPKKSGSSATSYVAVAARAIGK